MFETFPQRDDSNDKYDGIERQQNQDGNVEKVASTWNNKHNNIGFRPVSRPIENVWLCIFLLKLILLNIFEQFKHVIGYVFYQFCFNSVYIPAS